MSNRKKRRPNLNFTEMCIPIGAKLRAVVNGEVAIVATPRTVAFRGGEYTLSHATRLVLGIAYDTNPCPRWTFNGKNLGVIYDETYPVNG